MMESSVLRLVLFVILFLILTADYSSLLLKVFQMMGVVEHTDASRTTLRTSHDAEHSASQDKEQAAGGSSAINDALDILEASTKSKMLSTIKNSCLPKLICELNASHKEKLSDSEKTLLSMIRDTSISVTAEVTSRYHFAAHMGQLISGVDGAGCHNFYPSCPFPGLQVLQMMKKVRITAT